MDSVRKKLMITGVSQVWDDRPAWYFWIRDASGVYELELEDTAVASPKDVEWRQAALRLKCFPNVHGDLFDSFSFEERSLIKSPFFDATHTPCFEYRQHIPPNLFTVAALDYTIDHEDTVAAFTLESLDTWQTTFNCDTSIHFPLLGRSMAFKKGAIDRRVPGTRVGSVFFDRLLCLFSAFSKRPPEQVYTTSSNGFEYLCNRSGHLACVESSANRRTQVTVLYALSDTPLARCRVIELAAFLGSRSGDLIYDRTLSGHHSHLQSRRAENCPPLNGQWWTLAREEHCSGLASACGCS